MSHTIKIDDEAFGYLAKIKRLTTVQDNSYATRVALQFASKLMEDYFERGYRVLVDHNNGVQTEHRLVIRQPGELKVVK
jgi:hypothetical protein